MDEMIRDARIDSLGFAGELQKQFIDGLKSAVKASMLGKDAVEAEGDFFEAKLVESSARAVDAKKFYRRFMAGEMKETEFLGAISVKTSEAERLMSEKELDRMVIEGQPTVSLRVSRKKGVEVELVAAVRGLGEAIGK